MVLERALITVTPGREEEFEQAFTTARAQLEGSPGFVHGTLSRGVESPSTYLLLVEWQTLEDHTEGFRGSPAFTEWRRLLGPFFADAPAVEHYTQVANAGPGAR
jgi:heme-degrading monooxygenase HmoA